MNDVSTLTSMETEKEKLSYHKLAGQQDAIVTYRVFMVGLFVSIIAFLVSIRF
jgi:hypothetical protein